MSLTLRNLDANCPSCLKDFAGHLCSIAAEHDKTVLGGALLKMFQDVFFTQRSAIFRYVAHKGSRSVIKHAALDATGLHTHDAYLTSPNLGSSLEEHPVLTRSVNTGTVISEMSNDIHVYVFPMFRHEAVYLLIQLERTASFLKDELDLVAISLDFFRNHLELIDYAETDTLTGLLNRKTLDENLDRILASASGDSEGEANPNYPVRRHTHPDDSRNWLSIIDIDHFKRINDTFGHLIGDEILLLISRLMKDAFRLDDQLFRFGGEEFVVVLQPTSLKDASMVLDRFRRIVEEYQFPMVGHITVSLGFTRIEYYDSPSDLLDRADKALYFAKENGRNRMENYEALHQAGSLGNDREKSVIDLF